MPPWQWMAATGKVARSNGCWGWPLIHHSHGCWELVEPHYRFAFLSWWPERRRSAWLRLWRKGSHYDCRPLSCAQLERRLEYAGFMFEQLHETALKATFEIESPDHPLWKYVLRHVPEGVWHLTRRAFPTLIYRMDKA